jgi:hypothetical protein
MTTIEQVCKKLQISTRLLSAVKNSFESESFFHNFTLCERTALAVYQLREALFMPAKEDRIYVMAGLLSFAAHSQGKMTYADDLAFSIRFAQESLQKCKETEDVIEEVIRIIKLADAPQNTKLNFADRLLVAAGSMDFSYPDWADRFIEWEKESARKHQRAVEEHQAIRRAVSKLDGRMPYWPDIVKAKYLMWRTQLTVPPAESRNTLSF